MKNYKGIEAYKALQEGKVLEFAAKNEFIFSIGSDNLIRESKKGIGKWKYSDIGVNFFMGKTFIEYKEPLKYKVGDEVWVKMKVYEVAKHEQNDPYLVKQGMNVMWVSKEELKGIDE